MKVLRASFVTHCMLNCLNSRYVSLDPSSNGWKFVDNRWEPIWFEGNHLCHPGDAVDESREVDESIMAEGSGTVNESEIAETVEADFEKSKEISENSNDEDNIDFSDSCSDFNNDAH